MADLRVFLTDLGFTGVQTVLQSGNLVFHSEPQPTVDLERLLEDEARRRVDLETDFLVRTSEEWKTVVERNPYREEAARDPSHLVVVFLKSAVGAKEVDALRAAVRGPEILHGDGKQAYIVYPAGIGDSRLTNAVIESALGTRGTARNWNTVLKLAAVAGA
jgi:uncharacterized protein (DUF1697 family)